MTAPDLTPIPFETHHSSVWTNLDPNGQVRMDVQVGEIITTGSRR